MASSDGTLAIHNTSAIEYIAGNELLVYPNPVKHDLFIQSALPVEKIELYNQSGARVLVRTEETEKVDVSALTDGLYLVRIYVKDAAPVTQKIIIIK
jgi:hypothetical protein